MNLRRGPTLHHVEKTLGVGACYTAPRGGLEPHMKTPPARGRGCPIRYPSGQSVSGMKVYEPGATGWYPSGACGWDVPDVSSSPPTGTNVYEPGATGRYPAGASGAES